MTQFIRTSLYVVPTAPPTTGEWTVDDVSIGADGSGIWLCTASGSPGSWSEQGGGGSGNATSIQGVPVSATPPTNGEVIEYVAADSQYEPKPGGGGSGQPVFNPVLESGATYTANSWDLVLNAYSGTTQVVTAPASPSVGDQFSVMIYGGTGATSVVPNVGQTINNQSATGGAGIFVEQAVSAYTAVATFVYVASGSWMLLAAAGTDANLGATMKNVFNVDGFNTNSTIFSAAVGGVSVNAPFLVAMGLGMAVTHTLGVGTYTPTANDMVIRNAGLTTRAVELDASTYIDQLPQFLVFVTENTGGITFTTAAGLLDGGTGYTMPAHCVRIIWYDGNANYYTLSAYGDYAPLASPALTGTPTAPTASPLTDDTQIATTAYADLAVAVETARAEAAESALMNALSPTAIQTANYTATANQLVRADASGGSFTVKLPNTPVDKTVICVVCVAAPGANTLTVQSQGSDTILTGVATTATMRVNGETKLWQYQASTKIWLPLAQIPLTSLTAFILASSVLTGVPTAPTATPLTDNTQVATTAYADLAVGVETTRAEAAEALLAPLASPHLTGTPTAPTQTALDDSTKVATTAYTDLAVGVETTRAEAAEVLLAPLANAHLTGVPTVPTATPLTDSTQAASTAYADLAVAVETARAEAVKAPNANITSMVAVGHSWMCSGGSAGPNGIPNVAASNRGILSRLTGLLGVEDFNLINLAQGGSYLTNPSNFQGHPFSGWSGAAQFIWPDNTASFYGSPSNFVPYALGAMAGAAGVIGHGINDLALDPTSWSAAVSGLTQATQGLTAWANALAFVISRMRASNLYTMYTAESTNTLTWDSSIAFGGSWTNLGNVTHNSGAGFAFATATGTTVTITLPAVVPAAFTVGVGFLTNSTGYTTLTGNVAASGGVTLAVAGFTEFAGAGSIVVKIDSEEMLVTAGLGTGSWTVTAGNRGYNGTSAAAHSTGAVVISAPDTASVAFTGTVANSTGTVQLAGQSYAGAVGVVSKRIACTSADAGKTIVITGTLVLTGSTNNLIGFDGYWIESNDPPPVVVLNMPPALTGSYATNAIVSTMNTVTANVVGTFDSAVQVADIYTPFWKKDGVTTGSLAASGALSIGVTANDPTFSIGPGTRISVFAAGDASVEDMLVTAVSGSYPNFTLTVPSGNRGFNGSSAVAHGTSAEVVDRSRWYTDNLHPNEDGSAVIAETAFMSFQTAVNTLLPTKPYAVAKAAGNWTQRDMSLSVNLVDNWWTHPAGPIAGTLTTQNLLTAFPLFLPQICTVVGAQVNVTSVVAGSSVRVGLFSKAYNGTPGSLLADFGSVATAVGTGFKTISNVYQSLRPGWVWVAAVSQGGAPSMECLTVTGGGAGGLMASSPITGSIPGFSMVGTTVSGALSVNATNFSGATGTTPIFVWLNIRTSSFG